MTEQDYDDREHGDEDRAMTERGNNDKQGADDTEER